MVVRGKTFGLGAIIALIVFIVAVLAVLGVPLPEKTLWICVGLLALAILIP